MAQLHLFITERSNLAQVCANSLSALFLSCHSNFLLATKMLFRKRENRMEPSSWMFL